LLDATHAFLQEVSGAGGPLLDEPEHVLGLEVLREHEHGDVGIERTDLARGTEAFVGVGRRHPNVDHCHVRAHDANALEERIRVIDLLDDVDVCSTSRVAMPSRMSSASSAITTRMGIRHKRSYRPRAGYGL
jgi:hypothetical protein